MKETGEHEVRADTGREEEGWRRGAQRGVEPARRKAASWRERERAARMVERRGEA